MLAEERLDTIARLVDERGSVSAAELMELLDASESTVRRDIARLAAAGRVVKVHGGATSCGRAFVAADQPASEKQRLHAAEKRAIAAYAAALIGPEDFVYLDSGTTTASLVEALTETRATYVTNSVAHAHRLVAKGCRVLLPPGEVKPVTEALVGGLTAAELARYHFTLGFFGANGVSPDAGLTTPEPAEAQVKGVALQQTVRPYALADASKLSAVAPVTFAAFEDATVITDAVPAAWTAFENIVAVGAPAGAAHREEVRA